MTLLNLANEALDLTGWRLTDAVGRSQELSGGLTPGDTTRVTLEDGMRLSNSGGEIRLTNATGALADHVSYSRSQARDQGITTLF